MSAITLKEVEGAAEEQDELAQCVEKLVKGVADRPRNIDELRKVLETAMGVLVSAADRGPPKELSLSGRMAQSSRQLRSASSFSSLGERLLSSEDPKLKPFVSRISARCIAQKGERQALSSWDLVVAETEAVLVFIDISGYSKVTSALASRGAHALSAVVNAYLERILGVVEEHQGDVVAFAGDAVICVWPCSTETRGRTCVQACRCAARLQEQCGVHSIDDSLSFSLHIGIEVGVVSVEVFLLKNAQSMQSAFCFLSGEPFTVVGTSVDAAKSGEVCISSRVKEACVWSDTDEGNNKIRVKEHESVDGVWKLLAAGPFAETFVLDSEDDEVTDLVLASFAPNFVHSSIVSRLDFGFKPTEMAELRHLAVLFIDKRTADDPVHDWFSEVAEVLDGCGCPIIQIINDDKGTHLIAAVNLFVAEGNASSIAVAAVGKLMERKIECAIGVASGTVFCGILGSDVACRWDITGQACVRACRLMQKAGTLSGLGSTCVLLDQSVFAELDDVSQVVLVDDSLKVKGTAESFKVYTLRGENKFDVTSMVVSPGKWYPIHNDVVRAVEQHACDPTSDVLLPFCIISGSMGMGKKSIFARAAHGDCSEYVAFSHHCARNAQHFDLGFSIAQWFAHHNSTFLTGLSSQILAALTRGHRSKAMRLCARLVEATIETGMKTMMIVTHSEFIDDASLRFLVRLQGIEMHCPNPQGTEAVGRWATMLTHVPIFGAISLNYLATTIDRRASSDDRATLEKCRGGDEHLSLCRPHSKALTVFELQPFSYKELFSMNTSFNRPWTAGLTMTAVPFIASGGVIALFHATITHLMAEYARRYREGLPLTTIVTSEGRWIVTHEGFEHINNISWTRIMPQLTTAMSSAYDVLPPRLQLLMRVLSAMAIQNVNLFFPVAALIAVARAFVPPDVASNFVDDIQQLRVLSLTRTQATDDQNNNSVAVSNPALRDAIVALLTPSQLCSINKKAARVFSTAPFHREDPVHYLVVARFHHHAGQDEACEKTVARGWKLYSGLRAARGDASAAKEDQTALAMMAEFLAFEKSDFGPESLVKFLSEKCEACRGPMGPLATPVILFSDKPHNLAEVETLYAELVRERAKLGSNEAAVVPPMGMIFEDGKPPRSIKVLRCLADAAANRDLVSHDVVRAKNLEAPIALGPMASLLVEMGTRVAEVCLAAHVSNASDAPPQGLAAVDEELIDDYMKLVGAFEKAVPSVPHGVQPADEEREAEITEPFTQERRRLAALLTPAFSAEEALANVRSIVHYVEVDVQKRVDRAVAFARSFLPENIPQEAVPALKAALALLSSAGSQTLANHDLENDEIDRFKKALLMLATVNWKPRGMIGRINLKFIRASFFKSPRKVTDHFRSLLLMYALL